MKTLNRKNGFTLVELIVVVGMLMLLAGAITSSVQGAQRRAKIQQATVEAQEMTKAILSYENYGKEFSLKNYKRNNEDATESSLAFILGQGNAEISGQSGKVPVLFNASVTAGGKILDPWGRPYKVTIKENQIDAEQQGSMRFKSFVVFPNFNRRPADELKVN